MDDPNKPPVHTKESLWWPVLGICGLFALVFFIAKCTGTQSSPNQVPMVSGGDINERRVKELAEEEACMEFLRKGERPFGCEKYDFTRTPHLE